MNYCTPYPVRDYLCGTLNILHLPRFRQTTKHTPLLRCIFTRLPLAVEPEVTANEQNRGYHKRA
jgi:hypothetical protein